MRRVDGVFDRAGGVLDRDVAARRGVPTVRAKNGYHGFFESCRALQDRALHAHDAVVPLHRWDRRTADGGGARETAANRTFHVQSEDAHGHNVAEIDSILLRNFRDG
jgi:hypothetical protein